MVIFAPWVASIPSRFSVLSDDFQANILVNDAKQVCISDFGLTVVSTATALNTTMGTTNTRWLPRELLDGTLNDQDEHTDIYAFGCVCYEVYTDTLVLQTRLG